MDVILAAVAATAAGAFTLDLLRDLRRRFRPHTAAYAAGIGMFFLATAALAVALAVGWNGALYRVFFLFGAILNIPFLALGSMFLVAGRRAGHAMFLLLGGLAAISTTLTLTVPFAGPLPPSGVPEQIFPPISEGFGPRLLAAISGGTATMVLLVLALVSLVRFRRADPRIIWGNLLIALGTLAAATGGSLLGFLGETAAFELSLLGAATLIWAGYRTARGRRAVAPPRPRVVVVGPTVDSPERAHTEVLLAALDRAGFDVVCPVRDFESWGAVGYSPAEALRQALAAIDRATVLLVDLAHDVPTAVEAGYAKALRIPVVVAAPEGSRIPRALRGVAAEEVYYHAVDDIVARLARIRDAAPAGRPGAAARA
jgi:nucleoside 2-deoxyribosyltransferase